MWNYLWGMTERQIELLLADQPVTIYLDNDKKKGRKGVGADDMPKPLASDVNEAARKWSEKYGEGGGKVNISLGGLMRQGVSNQGTNGKQ